MTIKKSIALALFCFGLAFSTQAVATNLGSVISQAYELSLSNFRAPTTPNGTVTFKTCDDCERVTVRVTSGTRYTINGRTTKLVDFRKAIARANNRGAGVTVLHHLESDTIELINVSL